MCKMSQKRSQLSIEKKIVRHSLSLRVKLKILKRIDKGELIVDFPQVIGLPESTVWTI